MRELESFAVLMFRTELAIALVALVAVVVERAVFACWWKWRQRTDERYGLLVRAAVEGDEAATRALWREGGLRVIPGHYLARDGADGRNPGQGYIRVALVQDKETTAEALHRLVAVLG